MSFNDSFAAPNEASAGLSENDVSISLISLLNQQDTIGECIQAVCVYESMLPCGCTLGMHNNGCVCAMLQWAERHSPRVLPLILSASVHLLCHLERLERGFAHKQLHTCVETVN